MIRALRRLFGMCNHEYTSWAVFHQMNSHIGGVIKVFQSRKCQKCGYVQVKAEEAY
jgi:hypothetical protein